METVYLETSFISYLASRPSRDLIIAGHQQLTHEWWMTRRSDFMCVTSQVVLNEASQGDPAEASKRLSALEGVPVLRIVPQSEDLVRRILAEAILPPAAVRDAAHIALAIAHRVDYLLTWNCKHLANAEIIRRIEEVCIELGLRMPTICTAEELMGGKG
jgi:predicted nucleic acid-binding protein